MGTNRDETGEGKEKKKKRAKKRDLGIPFPVTGWEGVGK